MTVHAIIDFMHIYYKYFFQLQNGKLKHLSSPVDHGGVMVEQDTSLIYYPLRDIEEIRKRLENNGTNDVTISVCFDSPSMRKDTDNGSDYKAGRTNRLTEKDFFNINTIRDLLKDAGYNTYKLDGYEADDIVNKLVRDTHDTFDCIGIYTNDKDLLVNIDDKVIVMRYKATKGYMLINKENYTEVLSAEFGATIPYNVIGLFLSTVGDSADHIKGINKFGKKAFDKLIANLDSKYDMQWDKCGDYNILSSKLDKVKEFLTEVQYDEMMNAYALVSNSEIESCYVAEPKNKSTAELRQQAYSKFNMMSLCV